MYSENRTEILQELVEEQKRQIELMRQQLPGGMLLCRPGPPYSIVWASDDLAHLLGYQNSVHFLESIQGTSSNCIFPEDYALTCTKVQEALAQGRSYRVEYRAFCRDGSLLWVMEIGKMRTYSNGDSLLSCFITDISRPMERERALRRANQDATRRAQFLSQLYETVPCGIIQFILFPTPQIITLNQSALRMYGFDKQTLERSREKVYDSIIRNNLIYIQDVVEELSRHGGRAVCERRVYREDGKECWVNAILESIVNADGIRVIQAIFTDITETRSIQKEREQKQYIENRSLWTAVCSAYQLIMQINLTQNSFEGFSNQNYIVPVKTSGELDELVLHAADGILPEQRDAYLQAFSREKMLAHFQAGGKELYMELQRKDTEGIYHWVSFHCIRVDPEVSEDVLLILLVKILDEQRAEKAIQEKMMRDALQTAQDASRAKSDFLSRMSHDIRTPMNAIIGMSAIGQLKLDDTECLKECFHTIDSASRYLLSIINDILDMARIESGKMVVSHEPFDLEELLNQIDTLITPHAETAGVHTTLVRTEPLERIYIGDGLRIDQVLMNLMSNAIKFTPRGGKVTLRIQELYRDRKTAHLECIVSDTGCGMSAEFMERMFRPFEQECADSARDRVGSGLGLAIVQSLVHLMGGTLQVWSQEGTGTRFTILLPLEIVDTTHTEPDTPELQDDILLAFVQRCAGKRLLLVEDNEINIEIARSILEMQGLCIDTAENGQIAVEKFQEAASGYYHGILMDIRMPVLDGLDATRVIRSLSHADSRHIPIIAMSANAFEEDKVLALAAGMNDYIIKPIELDALFETLHRWI